MLFLNRPKYSITFLAYRDKWIILYIGRPLKQAAMSFNNFEEISVRLLLKRYVRTICRLKSQREGFKHEKAYK
jgi:hypothetical protein